MILFTAEYQHIMDEIGLHSTNFVQEAKRFKIRRFAMEQIGSHGGPFNTATQIRESLFSW